jgi:chromosome segregation ATPase
MANYHQRHWAARSLDENKNELFRILPQLETLVSTENKASAHILKNEIVDLIQNIQNQVETYHTQLLRELNNQKILVSNLEHDNSALRMQVHQNPNADALQREYAALSRRFDFLNSQHQQMHDKYNEREQLIHKFAHENAQLKAQMEKINSELEKANTIVRTLQQAVRRR